MNGVMHTDAKVVGTGQTTPLDLHMSSPPSKMALPDASHPGSESRQVLDETKLAQPGQKRSVK
jgi:hypothetical protein